MRPDKKISYISGLTRPISSHKKQLARINVVDLNSLSLVYEI